VRLARCCHTRRARLTRRLRTGLALLREAHALAPTHVQARVVTRSPLPRAWLTATPQVAETLGGVLAETGEAEEAVAVLRTAVALSPNAGFEKYMYLGQLLSGAEGIAHLRHGVALLNEAAAAGCAAAHSAPHKATRLPIPALTHATSTQELARRSRGAERAACGRTVLAGGRAHRGGCAGGGHRGGGGARAAGPRLAAHATQPGAAAGAPLRRCAVSVRHAECCAPVSQALAGLLAEQGHADEALAVLHQSLALWLPPAEAAEEEEERGIDPPSLEFRFDTAKLLLDLDHSTETAVRVLEARARRMRKRLVAARAAMVRARR